MKKIVLSFLVFTSTCAIAQNDSSFTITGNLSKVKTGIAFLTVYGGDSPKKDSAVITNGKFKFAGTASKPAVAILSIKDRKNDRLQFLADAGKIIINGTGDKLSELKITGSQLNIDDQKYNAAVKPANDAETKFYEAYDKAEKNKDQAMLDSLDAAEESLTLEKRKYVATFIKANPSSLRSAMAIEENYGYYAEASDVEPLYNYLNEKVRSSAPGIKVKKMLELYKTVAVGQMAPDIKQKDTLDNDISLSSLKGKYVLVDFWASWCGPCRKENPNIVKAYNSYKDKGFEIFGVSYDKTKAKWAKAIVSDGLVWKQVSDLQGWQNSTSEQYYIKAIPSNMLLDKDGKIIAKNLFGKKLQDKLAEIIQ